METSFYKMFYLKSSKSPPLGRWAVSGPIPPFLSPSRARPSSAQAAAAPARPSLRRLTGGAHLSGLSPTSRRPPRPRQTLAADLRVDSGRFRSDPVQLIEGFCSSRSPLPFPPRIKANGGGFELNRVRFEFISKNRVRVLPDLIPPVCGLISSI